MFSKTGTALISLEGLNESLRYGQVEQLLTDKELFIKLFAWSINGYSRRTNSEILFQATSHDDAVRLDIFTSLSDRSNWRKRIPHTVEVIRQVLLKIYRDKSTTTLSTVREMTRMYLTYQGEIITDKDIDTTQHLSVLVAENLVIFTNVILERLLRLLCNDDLTVKTEKSKLTLDACYEFSWTWRTPLLKPLTGHYHAHQRLAIARQQGIPSDFTINVGELDDSERLTSFSCHRIMLHTWGGDGFRALLRIGMVEGATRSVHLRDVQPSTVQFFLDGLYLGPKQLGKSGSMAEEVDLFDLISFSCSYQIIWLQNFCLNELKQQSSTLSSEQIRELLDRFPAWIGLRQLFRAGPGKITQITQENHKLPSSSLDHVVSSLLPLS